MRWFVSAALVVVGSFAVIAAEKDAAKEEIAKWQGVWRPVLMEHDGERTPDEKLNAIKLTVQDADYHFQNGDFSERGSYKFDPSQEPKALDIAVGEDDGGKVYLVIYKVEDDKLTICLRADNDKRPTEFTGAKGSGCVLEVWQREKP